MRNTWILLLVALICAGGYSCSKNSDVEHEEEVTPFDYNLLWYGNWLVEESSGIIHEGLFEKGDSFSGEVNNNGAKPNSCYLAKVEGNIHTTINFELDVDKNVLSGINVKTVDYGGDSFDSSHIKNVSIPGSFTVTRLDENNLHLRMVYSDGSEWIVKMKKIMWGQS